MEFILPKFRRKETPSGTYKITFDNKWTYIGSSTNIKKRFVRWKHVLSNTKWLHQKSIKHVLPDTKVIKFEVIRNYLNKTDLRSAENELLLQYWGSEFLLNRCPRADTLLNMRKPLGYEPPKKVDKNNNKYKSIKIAQFNSYGELIEIFPSKKAVSKKYPSCRSDRINLHLKGMSGSVGGFTFKLVAEDNISFVDTPKFRRSGSPNSRKVMQLNISGERLKTYSSIRQAAREIGCSEVLVRKAACGKYSRNKTAKGFYFKYDTD